MIKIGNDISSFSTYSCQPKNREELCEIVYDRIREKGPYCDLNDIDTSLIEDMSKLFLHSTFNSNISKCNVSNFKDM